MMRLLHVLTRCHLTQTCTPSASVVMRHRVLQRARTAWRCHHAAQLGPGGGQQRAAATTRGLCECTLSVTWPPQRQRRRHRATWQPQSCEKLL